MCVTTEDGHFSGLIWVNVEEYMLMSIMGWSNPTQAKKYIDKASRAKMVKGQTSTLISLLMILSRHWSGTWCSCV